MTNLAAFYQGKGKLTIQEIPVSELQADQIRIKLSYCGICGSDIHIYHGDMDRRVGDHRIIGHEASGIVEEVGEAVTDVKSGQKVCIRPILSCGNCPACRAGYQNTCHHLNCLGVDSDGAMRKYWDVPAQVVYPLPDHVSLREAALVEPLAVACHAVRLSQIVPKEKVVVIGAGAIGILTALTARAAGGDVFILEVNPYRAQIARELGFPLFNPKEINVVEKVMEITEEEGSPLIFEVSGVQAGVEIMTAIAASRARIIMLAIHPQPQKVDLFQVFRKELSIIGSRIQDPQDFREAIDLIAKQKLSFEKIITDIHPLEKVPTVFDNLDQTPTSLKTLIQLNR